MKHRMALVALAGCIASCGCSGASTDSPRPVETPFTLLSGRSQPTALLATSTHVYLEDGTGVVRALHEGGAIDDLRVGGRSFGGIAVDASSLYWMSRESSGQNGVIHQLSLSGTAPTVLAEGQTDPYPIAVGATHVFFGATEDAERGIFALRAVPKSGGSAFTIARGEQGVAGISTEGGEVFWVTNRPGVGTVLAASESGDAVRVLAIAPAEPRALVADSANVYFTTRAFNAGQQSSVMKVSRSGGTPTVLAGDEVEPFAIAVDASNVYWTNFRKGGAGTVRKVSKAGGTPVTIAEGQDGPDGIAVAGAYVFWSNFVTGTVMRSRITP